MLFQVIQDMLPIMKAIPRTNNWRIARQILGPRKGQVLQLHDPLMEPEINGPVWVYIDVGLHMQP